MKKKIDIREKVQKEATKKIIENKYHCLIHVSPRVGKSKIVIDALNKVNRPLDVLIIAPKKPILESWQVETTKWGLRDDIYIHYSWSNSLKKLDTVYDLIIADEIHEYNKNVLDLLQNHINNNTRIIALTGTLDGDTEYAVTKDLKIPLVYEYSIEQAINDKVVADYEIICIGCELDNTNKYVLAGNEEKRFYQTELEAYTYWNSQYNLAVTRKRWSSLKFLMSARLNIIYNSLTKVNVTKRLLETLDKQRCLIFTGRQEIADTIVPHSFHSKSEEDTLTMFKEGTIDHLAVVSMISMGITIPDLKIAIFNQLKSNENLCVQQSMRVMNMEDGKKATIYIIYLKNTQDEVWMNKALLGFNKNKIKYIDYV